MVGACPCIVRGSCCNSESRKTALRLRQLRNVAVGCHGIAIPAAAPGSPSSVRTSSSAPGSRPLFVLVHLLRNWFYPKEKTPQHHGRRRSSCDQPSLRGPLAMIATKRGGCSRTFTTAVASPYIFRSAAIGRATVNPKGAISDFRAGGKLCALCECGFLEDLRRGRGRQSIGGRLGGTWVAKQILAGYGAHLMSPWHAHRQGSEAPALRALC